MTVYLIYHIVPAKYSFTGIDGRQRHSAEAVEVDALASEQQIRYLCYDRHQRECHVLAILGIAEH